MKTKQKVIELQKQGLSPKEISEKTNTCIQNIYKHLREYKDKIPDEGRIINLSEKNLNYLADLIVLKLGNLK
jgi:transcriptional regulator